MSLIFGGKDRSVIPTMDPLSLDGMLRRLPISQTEPARVDTVGVHARAIKFKFRTRDLPSEERLGFLYSKWMLALLHAPEHSEVGRLCSSTSDEDEQLNFVADAFGGKSFSTLKKCLSQVTKFISWGSSCDPPRRVLPVCFDDVRSTFFALFLESMSRALL